MKILRAFPHDEATRVSYGVLNLTHRDNEGSYRLDDIDLTITARVTERYTYTDTDHTSVRGWCEWVSSF